MNHFSIAAIEIVTTSSPHHHSDDLNSEHYWGNKKEFLWAEPSCRLVPLW